MDGVLAFYITGCGIYASIFIFRKISLRIKEKKLSKILYKNKEKLNNNSLIKLKKCGIDECIICLDDFKKNDKIIQLYCNHVYHKKCLRQWFKESMTCPLCNTSLKTKYGMQLDELLRN